MPSIKPNHDSSSTPNASKKRTERTVSDAAPVSKRIRVSRACDQCRAGREKCDGIQPTCNACQGQKRPCTYNEQPKKRGIQPNYIRTLELTLTWILQTFPETERRLTNLIPDVSGDVHRSIAFKDVAKSEALHQVWRSSLVSRQIDQMLSGAPIECAENREPSVTPISPKDVPELFPEQSSTALDATDSFSIDALASPTAHENPPNLSTKTIPLLRSEPHVLKLPDLAWSLLEHYSSFTSSWLPITEKHDLLKLMYKYPQDGLSVPTTSSGDHAELWSILALTAAQKSMDFLETNTESMSDIAKCLIPDRESLFELGHVKALLIQCLMEISNEAWLAAWLAIGSAVRILTYLSSDMGQSKLLQIGRARHTFLAAFVLESAVAFHIGSHTHLRRSLVREVGLLIEDGLEEWSPWKDTSAADVNAANTPIMAISTFNKLVKVTEKLHDRYNLALGSIDNRSGIMDLIINLNQNATLSVDRRQPSSLVTDVLAIFPLDGKNSVSEADAMSSPSSTLAHFSRGLLTRSSIHRNQTPAFLSIPNPSTGSTFNDSPGPSNIPIESPDNFSNTNTQGDILQPQDMSFNFDTGGLLSTDIFEEFAALDNSDESARPQFMQNLGFGPDLDLAEFFGADYQLSDPMLAHLGT